MTNHRQSEVSLRAELAAALHSSGGWNARARRRVAAIAAHHGLPYGMVVGYLTNVVPSSNATVYDAIPPLDNFADEPIPSNPTRPVAPGVAPANVQPAPVRILPSRAAARTRSQGTDDAQRAATNQFFAAVVTFLIGALITLPLGAYLLREVSNLQSARQAQIAPPPTTTPTPSPDPAAAPAESEPVPAQPAAVPLPITYRQALARVWLDLRGSDQLTPALIENINELLDRARLEWTTFEPEAREQVTRFVVSTIFERGNVDADAATLIDAIDPAEPPAGGDGVRARLWSRAILLVLAGEPELPRPARRLVEERLREHGLKSPDSTRTFDEALPASLASLANWLAARTAGDVDDLDGWTAWVQALDTVADAEVRESLAIDAAENLLANGPDLTASESARHVLNAVLQPIDWAHTQAGRQRVMAWFNDPRVHSADLSYLTAYLVGGVKLPGLDDSYVLDAAANAAERARQRVRWRDAWTSGDELQSDDLDPVVADWLAHVRKAQQESLVMDSAALLDRLARMAEYNWAAARLELGDAEAARRIVSDSAGPAAPNAGQTNAAAESRAEHATATAGDPEGAVFARLQLGGPSTTGHGRARRGDGRWAIEFLLASKLNDREGQDNLFRDLVTSGDTDLGPIDAGFLVDLAISGQTAEIRAGAQRAIERAFSSGPVVLAHLADNLPPTARDSLLSQTIERITGDQLADPRDDDWHQSARRALLRRVVDLSHPAPTQLQASIDRLGLAYLGASDSSGISTAPLSAPDDPADAAATCLGRWRHLATVLAPTDPWPATLEDMERRRATRSAVYHDPVGNFAANQQAVLEHMLYVTAAEWPAARPQLEVLFEDVAHRHENAGHAVHQLLIIEEAIARVWMIRLHPEWRLHGLPEWRSAAAVPVHPAAPATGLSADLIARLEALSPDRPDDYVRLGEDLADVEEYALARRLFVLAATLDPDRLGRTAALALADLAQLAQDPVGWRRLRGMASMYPVPPDLGFGAAATVGGAAEVRDVERAAAAVATALGYYRRGEGQHAIRALQLHPLAEPLLRAYDGAIGSVGMMLTYCRTHEHCPTCRQALVIPCPTCRGGAQGGRCDNCGDRDFIVCPRCQGTPGPDLTDEQQRDLTLAQLALLAGPEAPWHAQFALDAARPRPPLDPAHLAASLGIDPEACVYRDGGWTTP